jgi:antitoxin component of RelBE/YafQ-DinJ toxin-antitoxin module
MKEEVIIMRIDKDLKKELEKVAKCLGMSLSAFMRMASIEKASKIDVSKEKKIK